MDSEPGRCRRTDGKKWRCSKDVLPDQKYCERHMHRGRQRSRKHVEITKNVTKSNSPKIFNSNKTTITINLPESAKKKSNSSTQLPEILQPIHNPSSNTGYKVCSASTPACTTSPIVYNRRKDNGNILRNSKSSNVAPASDTLPKGVLQSGVGCDTSTGALTETEPQRCRRTDGRKWRCSGNVLPEQKYCVQHIHRGVKKLTAASNPMPIASFPPLSAMPENSNTNDENETSSTSGSSSEATTITDDENTSDSSKYIIRARTSDMQAPF